MLEIKQELKYRPEIAGLRGLAVLSVVFYHLKVPYFQGGFIGVDIFFVISGYLVTKIIAEGLHSGNFSFSQFYARRARRILPALLTTVALCLIFGFLLFTPAHFERLAQSSLYAVLAVSNIFFFAEGGYTDIDAAFKPLLHTWTLGVEEQFYFAWPLTLLFLAQFKKLWSLVGLALIGIVSLIFSEVLLSSTQMASFYLMPFRIFELCIGAILVYLTSRTTLPRFFQELLSFFGLCFLILPILLFNEDTQFPGVFALIPCLGTAIFIYCEKSFLSTYFLENRLAVASGNISYSLYLLHWPIIVFYTYWNFGELSSSQNTIAFLLSIVCAIVMYRYIETPFRAQTPRISAIQPAKVGLIMASFVLLIAVTTAHIWGGKGWAWRVNNSLNSALPDNAQDVRATMSVCKKIAKTSGLRPCQFGAAPTDDNYDFLLVGDSHSLHFLYGLDQIFDEMGISAIYLLSGHNNLPLKGGVLLSDGKPGKNNNKEYAYLEEAKYNNVILAARWHIYSNTFAHDLRRRVYTWGVHSQETKESSLLAIEAGTRNTLQFFHDRGKDMYVIGQVPPFGPDANLCLNRPDYLVDLSTHRCGGFSKDKVQEISKASDYLFEQLSKELDFTYINFTDKLCDTECMSIIDDIYIYRDDDHINRFGSAALAQRYLRKEFGDYKK